jgi:hypothetical protein
MKMTVVLFVVLSFFFSCNNPAKPNTVTTTLFGKWQQTTSMNDTSKIIIFDIPDSCNLTMIGLRQYNIMNSIVADTLLNYKTNINFIQNNSVITFSDSISDWMFCKLRQDTLTIIGIDKDYGILNRLNSQSSNSIIGTWNYGALQVEYTGDSIFYQGMQHYKITYTQDYFYEIYSGVDTVPFCYNFISNDSARVYLASKYEHYNLTRQ